jgi:hypothetical protein
MSSQPTFRSFKCQLLKQSLVLYASQHFYYEILSRVMEILVKNHLRRKQLARTYVSKGLQIMLGLDLVFGVALHGQYAISIEQD